MVTEEYERLLANETGISVGRHDEMLIEYSCMKRVTVKFVPQLSSLRLTKKCIVSQVCLELEIGRRKVEIRSRACCDRRWNSRTLRGYCEVTKKVGMENDIVSKGNKCTSTFELGGASKNVSMATGVCELIFRKNKVPRVDPTFRCNRMKCYRNVISIYDSDELIVSSCATHGGTLNGTTSSRCR